MLAVITGTYLMISFTGVSATQDGTADVNIEKYIEFKIEFDEGEKLHIEAEIEASPYPVSIFLMKGEKAYEDWTESEDVDVQAIIDGENVTDITVSFKVIENFSEKNTTNFQGSIDIGDQDTYFLIIALHRDSSMTPKDLLSRASEVHYVVEWGVEDKDVPWGLLIPAGIFLIAGIGFIAAYYLTSSRNQIQIEDTEEERPRDRIGKGSHRIPQDRRRAPPMR
jgi:hypothetical protein